MNIELKKTDDFDVFMEQIAEVAFEIWNGEFDVFVSSQGRNITIEVPDKPEE